MGTRTALSRLDRKTDQFTVYRHIESRFQTAAHNRVSAIQEDREGRLWIGTFAGLETFDRSLGTFTVVTRKDGLPNSVIRGILLDKEGYLWLPLDNGLIRFDPQTKAQRAYSESDGLPATTLSP